MAKTTPILGLPWPELVDGADIEQAIKPLAEKLEALLTQSGAFIVGEIRWLCRTTAPPLWLPADGAARSRTTYAALWNAIREGHAGTSADPAPWGNGDGTTTFNVPDLRGRAPIGAGAGPGLASRVNGAKGGSEPANMPSHGHSINDPGHFHYIPGYPDASGGILAVTNLANASSPYAAATGSSGTGIGINPSGGGNDAFGRPVDNMMPFVAVPVYIYAGA